MHDSEATGESLSSVTKENGTDRRAALAIHLIRTTVHTVYVQTFTVSYLALVDNAETDS